MAIEITDEGNAVKVTYKDGNGDSASCVVIGEPVTHVKDNAQTYVDKHSLESEATA